MSLENIMIIIINNTQETITVSKKKIWYGWLTTSSALPISLIIILVESTLPLIEYGWQFAIIGIIAVGYGIVTIFVYRWTRKPDQNYTHNPDIQRYRTHIENIRIEIKSELEGTIAKSFYQIVNNSSRREQIFQHLITWLKFKGGELPKLLDDLLMTNLIKKHEIEPRLVDYIEKEFHKSFQHFYSSLTSKNPIGICDECKIDYFDSDKDEMLKCLKFYHKHENEFRKIFD